MSAAATMTVSAVKAGERVYLGFEIPFTPELSLRMRLTLEDEPVFLSERHARKVAELAGRDDQLTGVRVAEGVQW